MREYERAVTTVVNAALRPVCRPYLAGLADAADQVVVMTSAGGLLDVARAAELPAALLLSGPAAGARAAAEVARACGSPDALSFDMGGTSTDVCLILGGAPAVTAEQPVAGYPVRLPAVDIHTIGAGGGSIARIDAGGALLVGPESAGADPGPACYGLGGDRPTVTDANLALGRIPADSAFGTGSARVLDLDAARAAVGHAGVDAAGVIDVVNAGMEQALRQVSVARGVDPARLALVAFGGAGPLHACALAEAMGMTTVIVPAAAGVLSAVGLLISPRHRELVRTWASRERVDGLDDALAALTAAARAALGVEPCIVTTALDCRYAGQSHSLRVATVDEFHAAHERVNGYRRDDPVEVTTLRAVAEAPAPCTLTDVLTGWAGRWPEPVVGPAVEVREDCTIWVPEGWTGREGPLGSLVLSRAGDPG
jgi:N-methylhydantoinase A/oxoprolinase/acetone carboxylase beta subunit